VFERVSPALVGARLEFVLAAQAEQDRDLAQGSRDAQPRIAVGRGSVHPEQYTSFDAGGDDGK
jgi:hypothetical protein